MSAAYCNPNNQDNVHSKIIKILRLIMVVFFIILPALRCTNKKTARNTDMDVVKPYPHVIDMNEGFNNPAEIKLSEIADSIKYVVLSKDKQEVIGDIGKIQMADEHIYLRRSSDGLIMRFDMTGKFLNSFGNIGRGPKEYLPGSVFTTTPDDDRIVVFRGAMDSYLVFESDGNYLKTIDFPVSRALFDFRSLPDSVFLCTFYYIGSFMKDYFTDFINSSAGLFDLKGNPIRLIDHPLKNSDISEADAGNVVSMAPSITFFGNRIVLMPPGDTIYEIDSQSIFKGYIINWEASLTNKALRIIFLENPGLRTKHQSGVLFLKLMTELFPESYQRH